MDGTDSVGPVPLFESLKLSDEFNSQAPEKDAGDMKITDKSYDNETVTNIHQRAPVYGEDKCLDTIREVSSFSPSGNVSAYDSLTEKTNNLSRSFSGFRNARPRNFDSRNTGRNQDYRPRQSLTKEHWKTNKHTQSSRPNMHHYIDRQRPQQRQQYMHYLPHTGGEYFIPQYNMQDASPEDHKHALMTLNFFSHLQQQCGSSPDSRVKLPPESSMIAHSDGDKVAPQLGNDDQLSDSTAVSPQSNNDPVRLVDSSVISPPQQFRDKDVIIGFGTTYSASSFEALSSGTPQSCNVMVGSFVGNIPIVPTYAMQNVAISEQYKHSMSNSQQQLNISGTSDACGSDDGRRSMNEIASLNVDHPGSGSAGGSNSSSTSRKPPPPAPLVSAFDENGDFFVSKMDVLSEEIWNFHNSVTQTDTTLNRKLFLRDMLYYAISPIFPMCGLYVVGSSLNGFGNNSSDMDLCLMITNKDLDQKSDAVCVLNLVVLALEKVEWIREQHVIMAKVPILRIRFREPFGDITVDLNANNSVAIRNTHLLCYYSSFDWRVRPLVTIVKEWAKRMGMNDANKSSFTSYSLVLMVIHYLQCGLEIPILPALQQALPKIFNTKQDVRSLNVSHCLPSIPNWKQNSESNLGELLIGFLEYYSKHFRYENDAISVRLGKKIERAVVAKYPRNTAMLSTHWMAQWRCVCIEEPFTFSNTAHSIHEEMVFEKIKAAFRCAHDELSSTHDLNTWLENCKPIAAQSVNSGAMVSFEKTSDCCKVRTSTSLRSITSVTSTVQRTREDHSSTSTASSENEAETVKESAIAHLFSTGVIAAITPQTPTSPVHGRVHQQSQNAQLSNQRSRGQNGRNSRGKYFQARVQ